MSRYGSVMATVSDQQVGEILGAFWSPDIELFRAILQRSSRTGGDVAELGVLFGRSSVLIGQYLRPGEQFTCIDVFESLADEVAADDPNHYPGLTRAGFEANYRRHHGDLPTVVTGFSQDIARHARVGTHRFVHIDASHLYEHVAHDIEAVRPLMHTDGVVVLDDYRAEHTPGVAAAAWQSVTGSALRPFALTPAKMYATWGDADQWRAYVAEWAAAEGKATEVQAINGTDVLLIRNPPEPPPHRLRRWVAPVMWPYVRRLRRFTAR